MATENHNYDPFRNPQVDYERADLSPRGIIYFLVGLLICGIFIELVIWGMFRFMAKSEVLFSQGQPNPMMSAQKKVPETVSGSGLQNFPAVNLSDFPQPRLQVDDAADMSRSLTSEKDILNVQQPFTDSAGVVHIPISLAMKLIEERGLPVRPSTLPDIAMPAAANHSTGMSKGLNQTGESTAGMTKSGSGGAQ